MTKKKKEIDEPEPLTDIIDAETLEILDKTVQELDKELEKKQENELISEVRVEKVLTKEFTEGMQETTFYLNFFMTIFMTIINPLLVKFEIDIITVDETKELSQALIGIASEKMLSKSTKIGKSISKIVNLPKIMKLVTVLWKMVFPRLTKYLEISKKKTPENVKVDNYGL